MGTLYWTISNSIVKSEQVISSNGNRVVQIKKENPTNLEGEHNLLCEEIQFN